MNDADDFAAATSASNLTCCEGHVVGMPYFGQEHGGMLFFQWVYLVADTRHLTRRPCLPVCVCVCVCWAVVWYKLCPGSFPLADK